jgi:hypothetical protein
MYISGIRIGNNLEDKMNKLAMNGRNMDDYMTNQTLVQVEIMGILNSGNVYYHSVQKLSFSHLSKNIKITIYKTIMLPVVLHGCDTWV